MKWSVFVSEFAWPYETTMVIIIKTNVNHHAQIEFVFLAK